MSSKKIVMSRVCQEPALRYEEKSFYRHLKTCLFYCLAVTCLKWFI